MRMIRLATAMAAISAVLVLSTMVASAQPGAPPPPGGGYYGAPAPAHGPSFRHRQGLTLGVGFGIGDMSADSGPIDCLDCSYDPGAAGFDFHIGGMLNPRLALLFELWISGKTLDAGGSATLFQSVAMVAGQYWVTPRLWLKGGLGAAHLSVTYDDGYYAGDEPIDDGLAAMGALGYELVAGPRFALDVQLRLGTGSYDGIGDQIHTGLLGLGFNWY